MRLPAEAASHSVQIGHDPGHAFYVDHEKPSKGRFACVVFPMRGHQGWLPHPDVDVSMTPLGPQPSGSDRQSKPAAAPRAAGSPCRSIQHAGGVSVALDAAIRLAPRRKRRRMPKLPAWQSDHEPPRVTCLWSRAAEMRCAEGSEGEVDAQGEVCGRGRLPRQAVRKLSEVERGGRVSMFAPGVGCEGRAGLRGAGNRAWPNYRSARSDMRQNWAEQLAGNTPANEQVPGVISRSRKVRAEGLPLRLSICDVFGSAHSALVDVPML